MIRKWVAWLACLSLLWTPVRAADISGTVYNAESGEQVPFAAAQLSGADSTGQPFETGAQADDSGHFRLEFLPSGRFELVVTIVGYEDYRDSLWLSTESSLDIEVELVPRPIEGEGVVVEAARLEVEQEKVVQPAIISIKGEVLRDIPSVGEPDPIRSLQLLPGVQAASDISSGLYVRGGGPDQTLVLFDNVTVYNPTHAFGFFSTFNADIIEDVTLYKGAYPAAYGGRLGAVLDVRSLEPRAEKVTGVVGISTIASRLTLQGSLGRHHWLLSGRRTYLDPLLNILRKSDPAIPSYYFYDFNGKFVYRHDHGTTTLGLYRGRDDLRSELDTGSFIDINWGNTVGVLTHRRTLGRRVTAEAMLAGTLYESLTDVSIFFTPFDFENRLLELTAQGRLWWQAGAQHRLQLGLEYSSYDFQYVQSFNNDVGVDYRSRPMEVALYVDDQWTPGALATLRAGMRLRYLTDGDRVFAEPRVSLSRSVGSVRLKLAGGVYNQYLQLIGTEGFSAGDVFVPVDESADPGRSWQSVIGADWTVNSTYRLSAEVYYTRLENLLTLDGRSPVDEVTLRAADVFLTGGRGYATGLELFAEKRAGALRGWIGYTLGTTRRTFDELNDGAEFSPKYDRRHDINFVASYRTGPWSLNASFIYATGQAFTPATARFDLLDTGTGQDSDGSLVLAAPRNTARLLPYHRLDVGVARRFRLFGLPARLIVQVSNFYNRRNEWFVQFDPESAEAEVVKQLPLIPSLGLEFTF